MTIHSCVLAPDIKQPLSAGAAGKYGRMFPHLHSRQASEVALLTLAKAGASMDAGTGAVDADDPEGDNPRIPAGLPIFGQFVAHDITADRSLLQHHARTGELQNFRTPRLDLEGLYGAGPTGSPYLYDVEDPDKFLLGENDLGEENDVPRNRQGRALVADPRNDVHLPISQFHLAFLKFHNAVVDHLRLQGMPAQEIFPRAQRQVQWHYQWIVVSEFLPLSVGQSLVEAILDDGPRFYLPDGQPSIPVEFADAAYRFGHSQIRTTYRLNSKATGCLFPDCAGGRPVSHQQAIDWHYFFSIEDAFQPQPSRRIDARLAHSLMDLPTSVVGDTELPEHRSLACRDLLRAHALDLPSGEAIAQAMGVEVLTEDEIGIRALGWKSGQTPLWYYLLREARVRTGGEYLGEVGGRIVAEVLIGLLGNDPEAYLNASPAWKPTLPAAQNGSFTIADLLRFARVV
jgi:Animal haem peroxidase